MQTVIRTATVKDFPGILKMMIAAFSENQPAHGLFDEVMPETIRPEKRLLDNWYIAVEGDEVIASTQLVPQRLIVAPGVELGFAGIGQVSCHPDHGGRGLMTELLKAAIKRMTEDGYHVSILGGDRQRYRRFGWEVAGSVRTLALHARRITGTPVMPATGNRPTRWAGEEATVARIHQAYEKNVTRRIRTCEETGLILRRLNIATWVHECEGEFAYVCLAGKTIAEYGGDARAFEQLLSYLLMRTTLSASIPAGEGSGPLEEIMLDFAGHYSQNYADMIRVISLKRVLEAYRPVLEKRLCAWQGAMVLEMADDGEKVAIGRAGSGLLRIEPGEGAADIRLDRPDWALALFGPFAPVGVGDLRAQAFVREALCLPIAWPLLCQI